MSKSTKAKPVAIPTEVTLDSHTLGRVLDKKAVKRLMIAAVEDGLFIGDAEEVCRELGIPHRVALV